MSAPQQNVEIVKLTPPPQPTKENIYGFNFGIRPYRIGGIRLERQIYKDKIFYHNYGHGGAGVSVAYGCARHIVDIFKKDVDNTVKDVAIIGGGYMGLMESLLLADLGFKVTVYAKDFAKDIGIYDGKNCITSQVAGGLWMPFGVDVKDKALHHLLSKTSFEYYQKCIEAKEYKGLSFRSIYFMDEQNMDSDLCPPGLIEPRSVKIDFGNGVLHEALTFKGILIDGDVFLKELYEEAVSKGVKFETKSFDNIVDLCELKEKHIFNCTGSYSRVLFNDTNIIPIVGHLLYLKKIPEMDYFLESKTKDGKGTVCCFPHSNKIAIGLTYEKRGWLDKPDPESVQTLINNLEGFLEWRTGLKLKPKL